MTPRQIRGVERLMNIRPKWVGIQCVLDDIGLHQCSRHFVINQHVFICSDCRSFSSICFDRLEIKMMIIINNGLIVYVEKS